MLSYKHKSLSRILVAALLAALVVGVYPTVAGAAPATPPTSDIWYLSLIHISEPTRPY